MHAIADQKLVKKKGNILYEESFLKSSFQILDLKKTYSVCLQFTCVFALSVLNHFLSFIQDDSLVNFGLKIAQGKYLTGITREEETEGEWEGEEVEEYYQITRGQKGYRILFNVTQVLKS